MYHNTTQSTGDEFRFYIRQARNQELAILLVFEVRENALTCSELLRYLIAIDHPRWGSTPLTSVRRAVTDLMNEHKLVKTTTQRKGPYGRPEFAYALPAKQRRLFK